MGSPGCHETDGTSHWNPWDSHGTPVRSPGITINIYLVCPSPTCHLDGTRACGISSFCLILLTKVLGRRGDIVLLCTPTKAWCP